MSGRTVIVLVNGRRLDVTGLDLRAVVDRLRAEAITAADIDHKIDVLPPGPIPPGTCSYATRDLRRWLGGYAAPEQRYELIADLEAFYDETGRPALQHWEAYLAWKARKLEAKA